MKFSKNNEIPKKAENDEILKIMNFQKIMKFSKNEFPKSRNSQNNEFPKIMNFQKIMKFSK